MQPLLPLLGVNQSPRVSGTWWVEYWWPHWRGTTAWPWSHVAAKWLHNQGPNSESATAWWWYPLTTRTWWVRCHRKWQVVPSSVRLPHRRVWVHVLCRRTSKQCTGWSPRCRLGWRTVGGWRLCSGWASRAWVRASSAWRRGSASRAATSRRSRALVLTAEWPWLSICSVRSISKRCVTALRVPN